jgi:hypothetical protein
MLRSLHMLVLALATTLAGASSAVALTAESALRANSEFSQPRVTDFAAQRREAHQQITLGYGESASDSSLASRGAGEAERLVIGRGADLAKPGALNPGEFKLGWESKLPDFKAEWKMNEGFLRQEMRNMRPIRDASPGDTGGIFLNAERNLLRDRGWSFDANTSQWMPPGG